MPGEEWNGREFARQLAVLMAERGLETKGLAEATGLSYPQLRRILRGRSTPPSQPELHAIAAALGVTPDVLLGEATRRGPARTEDRLSVLEERLERVEAVAERLERLLHEADGARAP